MVALGAFYSIEAKAFPFDPTPEGFINWANSLTFAYGQTFEFLNPRNCNKFNNNNNYICDVDYKETTSLGTRTCINVSIIYDSNKKFRWFTERYRGWEEEIRFECSEWEKVSLKPQPSPEAKPCPAPQPSPAPKPNIERITLANIGIGAISLIVGACFGGFVVGRKKNIKS